MLWAATVGFTAYRGARSHRPAARKRLRWVAGWQALTLPVALLLAAFWLVPMLSQGAFFVTRPMPTPSDELTNGLLFVWYALAAVGLVLWMRRPSPGAAPMVLTLTVGYAALYLVSQDVLLAWIPLHVPRFLSTLNTLAAVPVGVAVLHGARAAALRFGFAGRLRRPGWLLALAALLLIALRPLVLPADYRLAFYSDSNGDFRRVEPILRFAESHRDGRYVVEQPPFSAVGPALDSRAIASYLAMQGNEALNTSFREAQISAPLLYPLAGSVSSGKDNFGLSSILAEDTDFLGEDVEDHIRQAVQYRVRYFVMVTSAAKTHVAMLGPDRYVRHDFGVWTIFEMKGPIPLEGSPLASKPVLVLTAFSAKLTRQSDYNFLRFAEEDFAHSVGLPIAFGPDYRADHLPDPSMFSALVVEDYRYRDMNAAFAQIQLFSRERPIVLLESQDPLFRLLVQRSSELGQVAVVRRTPPSSDRWIGTTRYGSYRGDSVRQTWRRAMAALRPLLPEEILGFLPNCELRWESGGQDIRCDTRATGDAVPVAINNNFHPEWRAADGQPLLMLGPSLTYAGVQGETQLKFQRSGLDHAAVVVSALTLAAVMVGILWGLRARVAA